MYDKRLDAILKTAELGSFNKAAQAMGYSVPALTKQVSGFESQMGITLFERSNKGVHLTAGGKAFVEDARSIIAQCDFALKKARESQARVDNLIRVGISLYQSGQRMLELCRGLYVSATDLSIQFIPMGDTFEAYKQVAENFEDRIDVFGSTFLPEVNTATCNVVELARPRLCIAIPVNDPLALAEPLALGDLAGRRMRIPERGNPYVDAARERIAQHAAGIELVEFPHYDIRVFDECAQCDDLLLSKEIWRGVHPFMQTMEVQWDLVEPYCLYFAKHPRPAVARFVAALQDISSRQMA